ncbi:MAG: hypothetical protein KDA24_18695 [Deltaproteobacteria bacterium]|nr:hypothetical protein [Deltaproteobacteria bacterium]
MKTHTLLLAALLAGCAGPSAGSLPPDESAELALYTAEQTLLGDAIYRGRVQRRGPDDGALFTYQRHVIVDGEHQVSSHLTLSEDDQSGVVLHQASHDAQYRVQWLRELHAQTGLVGTVDIADDGTATFEVSVDGSTRSRTETGDAPVQVGPTLFGFALAHWGELLGGDAVPLRFAVLKDLRTYRFVLELEATDAETTSFTMRASSPFVAAAVPAMRLTFDTDTHEVVRYEGAVPPFANEDGKLVEFEGRVDYTFLATQYL